MDFDTYLTDAVNQAEHDAVARIGVAHFQKYRQLKDTDPKTAEYHNKVSAAADKLRDLLRAHPEK